MPTPPFDVDVTGGFQPDPDSNEPGSGPKRKGSAISVTQFFRNRIWLLSIVLAMVTVSTMIFAWWNLKVWFYIIAIVFAGCALLVLLVWKVPKWQVDRYRKRLEPKDQVELEIQARSTLIQIVGGVAVVMSIFFTAANLQLTAKNVQTAEESSRDANELARLTQITERYAKAVEQLESKDLEVRLAGIYSLEILARETAVKKNANPGTEPHNDKTPKPNEYHTPIMLVLAAHVRSSSPWKPKSTDAERPTKADSKTEAAPDTIPQDRIPQDIQTILTVIGRRDTTFEDKNFELDLRDADLRGADMERGHFERVNFSGCNLAGANLSKAFLTAANFGESDLTSAILDGAQMERANLEGATLRLTSLRGVNLNGGKLNLATVENAIFDNADLNGVEFNQATGGGNYFQGARLKGAVGFQADWAKDQSIVN